MKAPAKTPAGRSIQWLQVQVRRGRLTSARMYELGSEIAGRKLAPGFGLSTLVLAELVRLCRRVKVEIGEEPGETSRGRRDFGWDNDADGAIHIASLSALQMIRGLQEEMHLSDAEVSGVTWIASGKQTRRAKTAHEARVTIEALWAMKERRQKATARSAAAGGGAAASDRSDPTSAAAAGGTP
jgi:hypothetical protein